MFRTINIEINTGRRYCAFEFLLPRANASDMYLLGKKRKHVSRDKRPQGKLWMEVEVDGTVMT